MSTDPFQFLKTEPAQSASAQPHAQQCAEPSAEDLHISLAMGFYSGGRLKKISFGDIVFPFAQKENPPQDSPR